MLKIFDTICEKCKYEKEQMVNSQDEFEKCPKCNGNMIRVFSTMNFKLKYDPKKDTVSWANEGYASSQYWKEVKKQREEGKDVKGVHEN